MSEGPLLSEPVAALREANQTARALLQLYDVAGESGKASSRWSATMEGCAATCDRSLSRIDRALSEQGVLPKAPTPESIWLQSAATAVQELVAGENCDARIEQLLEGEAELRNHLSAARSGAPRDADWIGELIDASRQSTRDLTALLSDDSEAS